MTDGLASAISQALAFSQEKDVALNAGHLTGQALAAGLVDELAVNLVPVPGERVTHLRYRVRKG